MNFNKIQMVILLVGLFLISWTSTSLSNTTSSKDEVQKLYISAVDIIKSDFSKGEEMLKKIILKYPETTYAAQSFDLLAEKYDRNGHHYKIVALYEASNKKKLSISDYSLFLILGTYCFDKQYDNAVQVITQIDINNLKEEDKISYIMFSCITYYYVGQDVEGKRYETMFLEYYPDEEDSIYGVIGSVFLEQKNFNKAAEYFKKYSSAFVRNIQKQDETKIAQFISIQVFFMHQKMYKEIFENLSALRGNERILGAIYHQYIYLLGVAAYHVQEYKIAKESFEYLKIHATDGIMKQAVELYLSKIAK